MNRIPRHRNLDALTHRLDRAARIVPEVIDHLNEQRALVKPIGAHNTDAGPSSRGDHSDPTVNTVLRLDVIEYRRAAITDAIATLGKCVDMLDEACRDALGTRAPEARSSEQPASNERCVGDSTPEGADCWNIPTSRRLNDGSEVDDGRCLECGPRYDVAEASRRSSIEQARRLRRRGAA